MAGAENTKCRSVRFGEIVAVAKNVRTQIYTKIQTAKIVHTNIHKNTKSQRMYIERTQIYTKIQNCKDGTHKYTQNYKITKNVRTQIYTKIQNCKDGTHKYT